MSTSTLSLNTTLELIESGWNWWIDQLRWLVPTRGIREGRASTVFVEFGDGDVTICKVKRGAVSVIERVRPGTKRPKHISLLKKSKTLQIAIPEDQAFIRNIDFPEAAASNVRNVIGLQLERLSPLKPEQVSYDCAIIGKTEKPLHISVDLAVIRREVIASVLKTIEQWGLQPARIGLLENGTSNIRFNFLRAENTSDGLTSFKLNALLLMLLCALSLFSWDIVQDRWQRDAATWQSAILQAKTDSQRATAIQQQIDKLEESRRFLIQQKTGTSPLAVLSEISRIMPDTAWVAEMRLQGEELQLIGFAENASELPELIESSPLFGNARFQSPLRQAPRQKGGEV